MIRVPISINSSLSDVYTIIANWQPALNGVILTSGLPVYWPSGFVKVQNGFLFVSRLHSDPCTLTSRHEIDSTQSPETTPVCASTLEQLQCRYGYLHLWEFG